MGKKIVFMLLCSISCLGISAQKTATVKNFTQTTDHISASDRRNDLNGDPCALVKVQVVDEVTRVEGNKIGNIVDKGVEKWIYMCKGSRNMRVHLKNHLPVKVMFQDYEISGLESNRVYELVIETPNNATITSSQKLIMNYNPTNAMVLIDSKPYKGNGRIEIVLPIGEHKYIIAADGYNTAEGVVKLNEMGVREITEYLTADNDKVVVQMPVQTDNPTTTTGGQQTTPVYTQPQKDNRQETPTYIGTSSSKDDQYGHSEPVVTQPTTRITPPRPLNKSFKVNYEGVTFKCKAKKGYITITGFDTNAGNVTIPAKVEFEGNYYPVRDIDTFINGNNYSATRLVIEDGVEIIDNFAFVEFRKLMEVTIPNSIKEIGKNAFRDNSGMKFNVPSNISEYDLRAGRTIKVR